VQHAKDLVAYFRKQSEKLAMNQELGRLQTIETEKKIIESKIQLYLVDNL
jgi:hypothetical protein